MFRFNAFPPENSSNISSLIAWITTKPEPNHYRTPKGTLMLLQTESKFLNRSDKFALILWKNLKSYGGSINKEERKWQQVS